MASRTQTKAPRPGSHQAVVLDCLRKAGGPCHIDQLARAIKSSRSKQARNAIDGLRLKHWPIDNEDPGSCRFVLRRAA